MSKWQTTLLPLRRVKPTLAMSLVGRNGLTHRTLTIGTSEAEGGGGGGVAATANVDVDVGVAEGVKVEAEEGGRAVTARIRRATRRGRWVDKNTSQWFCSPQLSHD